jgi:hypothetical protein
MVTESNGALQMRSSSLVLWFVGIASVVTVALRLLPHAPNFTPVGALALFSGAYLTGYRKFWVPVIVMGVSDFFIGFYDYKLMLVVYSSFLVLVGLGSWLRGRVSPWRVGLGTIYGASCFFLLTNLAVWAFSSWYPHTLAGLFSAYTMGLPFFRMTLLGDLFYGAIFFGAYEFIKVARLYRVGYTLPVRVISGTGDTALLEKRFDNI